MDAAFDWGLIATGGGTIDEKGRIQIAVNGDVLKGVVTAKGVGTAAVTTHDSEREKFRWTTSFTRRFLSGGLRSNGVIERVNLLGSGFLWP